MPTARSRLLIPQNSTPRPRRTRSPPGILPGQRLQTLNPLPILRLQNPPPQIRMIRVIGRRFRNDRTRSTGFRIWAGLVGAWMGGYGVVGVVVVLFWTQELSGVVRIHRAFRRGAAYWFHDGGFLLRGPMCWEWRRDAITLIPLSLFHPRHPRLLAFIFFKGDPWCSRCGIRDRGRGAGAGGESDGWVRGRVEFLEFAE
jgi:hypothetical protein